MKNNLKKMNKKGGYTIIETMIAIAVFLVLIMTGMTTLVNAFSVHKKSQNMRSEMDNLSFILEDMSRNLRTGTQFYCLNNYDNDSFMTSNINQRKSSPVDIGGTRQICWGIAFEAASGGSDPQDQWVYYIDGNGAIQKAVMGPYTEPLNFNTLTPPEVILNPVSGFYIFGAEAIPGDKQQPFIKIILAGSVSDRGVTSPFSLETVVSSRAIDTF
ncbi:MAG: prepilin-type N-terminal cleavage/methylation domain-containing protein [Candidatus Paceibacterota bacterium]|jgi:type II secretory pathway pseudopilin PulG